MKTYVICFATYTRDVRVAWIFGHPDFLTRPGLVGLVWSGFNLKFESGPK